MRPRADEHPELASQLNVDTLEPVQRNRHGVKRVDILFTLLSNLDGMF